MKKCFVEKVAGVSNNTVSIAFWPSIQIMSAEGYLVIGLDFPLTVYVSLS